MAKGSGGGGRAGRSGGSRPLSDSQQSRIGHAERRIGQSQTLIDRAQRALNRQSSGGAVRRLRPDTISDYRRIIRQETRAIENERSRIAEIRAER